MKNTTGFISIFMSAVSNCRLYSRNHSAVDELVEKTLAMLRSSLDEAGTFEMMIIENDLVFDKNPVGEVGIQGQNLIKRLKKKGISHINFSKGLTLAELKNLIGDISTAGKGLKSLPHVKTGTIDAQTGEISAAQEFDFLKEKSQDIQRNISDFTEEQIEKAKDELSKISPLKQLHLAGFEEIVAQFVLMLKKEGNVLKILKPSHPSAGHDATHSTNVSVLTIFQAQSLGIKEEFHGEIGLAAFLHDVGKLVIPRELIEHADPKRREELLTELHSLYGSQYLSKINGLTRLAPIVAFEHHLRYDGRGHPKLKVRNIKQHLCSQMTAISDAFDTLRNTTPQQKALDLKQTLVAMKTKDPGLFNPFLVDNFIRSIHLALS